MHLISSFMGSRRKVFRVRAFHYFDYVENPVHLVDVTIVVSISNRFKTVNVHTFDWNSAESCILMVFPHSAGESISCFGIGSNYFGVFTPYIVLIFSK